MQREVLRSVLNILVALRVKRPYEDILNLILESAAQLANAVHGSFITVNQTTRDLTITSTYGPDWDEEKRACSLHFGQGITGTVAATGRPILCNDVTQDPTYFSLFDYVRSELAVPVIVDDFVWGIINLDGLTVDAFDDQMLQTIEVMAELAASAINLRLEIDREEALQYELHQARDAALESNRLKSEFLANMSHEIRTPMNGVLGMITLLLETPLNERQRHFVSTARKSAEGLLTILNEILDFSKIEAGKVELEEVTFNPHEVVQHALELLAARAQSKGLDLNSFVGRDVPALLRGDPTRVRQVLLNLVSNGIKFTERGGVFVRVDKITEEDEHVDICFSIVDTGIGIPAEVRDRLFQAFTQADGSTTRKYGGTGLGLAISKKLVELMGGKISFISDEGEGTSFWFTLRFTKVNAVLSPAKTVAEPLRGLRILFVETNPVARDILSKHAANWFMDFVTVITPGEAIEAMQQSAAQQRHYHFLVINLPVPERDGLILAASIKHDPRLARTKVILQCAVGVDIPADRLQEAGVATLLYKPVSHTQLYDSLLALHLNLKVESPRSTVAQKRKAELAPDRVTLPKLKILVTDDSETNREVAMFLLEGAGHHVVTMGSGAEAIQALEKEDYDLVFMDVQMPDLDGLETTRRIRRGDTRVRRPDMPIIAMTAYAMRGDRERCIQAGMDDYVTKPVLLPELQAAIDRVWRQQATVARSALGLKELSDSASVSAPQVEQIIYAANFPPEIVESFLRETRRRLGELKRAIGEGDLKSIAQISHTIRGTATTFGMNKMNELCLRLEEKSGDALPEQMRAWQEELDTLLTEVEAIYRARQMGEN